MLALRKVEAAPGGRLVETPTPETAPPGAVVIRVAAAGLCGSDLHAFDWTPGYGFMADRLPVTLGHEIAGIVVALGEGVGSVRPGDRVTCAPFVGCGACAACRAARPEDCPERRVLGLHMDGGFAERLVAPAANCRRLPPGLPLDLAALAEPLAVAVNAVSVGEVAAGERVIALGAGPIGVMAAWAAARRGAEVLLLGRNDADRLAVAETLGLRTADVAGDGAGGTLAAAAARAFDGPVDRVLEATGAASAVAEALDLLRGGGVLVVAGIHDRPLTLDLTALVRSRRQLRGAWGAPDAALDEAVALLAAHPDALSRLVTHRLPLEEAERGFALARERKALKVLLTPPGASDMETAR